MICDACARAADYQVNGSRPVAQPCPYCERLIAPAGPGSERRCRHRIFAYESPRLRGQLKPPWCKGSGKVMFTGAPTHCTDPTCTCQHRPVGTLLNNRKA